MANHRKSNTYFAIQLLLKYVDILKNADFGLKMVKLAKLRGHVT